MCRFLSGLVLRNGDVLTHPMLDSHSDLVMYFKLPDTSAYVHHFAKVELVPDGHDWLDPDTWVWHVDEPVMPVWWTEIAEQAEASLRSRAKGYIIRSEER